MCRWYNEANDICEDAELRLCEVVSIVDYTPLAANFLRNSNKSNRIHWNGLNIPSAGSSQASSAPVT